MKLIKNCDMKKFMEVVKKCKGEVLFCSPQGDRLNLKSTITRMLLVTLIDDPDYVASATIECADESDYEFLTDYLQK